MTLNGIKKVKLGEIEVEMWKNKEVFTAIEDKKDDEKISIEEAFRREQDKLNKIDMGLT